MSTAVTVTNVSKLDKQAKQELARLSFKRKGALANALMGRSNYVVPNNPIDMWVYVMRNTDTGKVVCWALVRKFREPLPEWNKKSQYTSSIAKNYYDFMIYTRASERRKGYGSELFKRAQKRFGVDLAVYRHDPKSSTFYDGLGAKV